MKTESHHVSIAW